MARALSIPITEFSAKLASILETSRLTARECLGLLLYEVKLIPGVSVSGGMDSMALCTLLQKHREREGWPTNLFAYTVDHKVRAESADEAKKVADWVKSMGTIVRHLFTTGFNHRILEPSVMFKKRLDGNKFDNVLEAAMREERRRLVLQAAQEDLLGMLLVAHHQDDQYETLLLRLASGSGLAGLGGMAVKKDKMVRPLLDYPKVSPYLRPNARHDYKLHVKSTKFPGLTIQPISTGHMLYAMLYEAWFKPKPIFHLPYERKIS
jgi:tRNA(Ile)-lysidine synthetase-like protein